MESHRVAHLLPCISIWLILSHLTGQSCHQLATTGASGYGKRQPVTSGDPQDISAWNRPRISRTSTWLTVPPLIEWYVALMIQNIRIRSEEYRIVISIIYIHNLCSARLHCDLDRLARTHLVHCLLIFRDGVDICHLSISASALCEYFFTSLTNHALDSDPTTVQIFHGPWETMHLRE